MNIAGLRVRITIQKNETIVDKYGNHKTGWTDYFKCWATAVTDERLIFQRGRGSGAYGGG